MITAGKPAGDGDTPLDIMDEKEGFGGMTGYPWDGLRDRTLKPFYSEEMKMYRFAAAPICDRNPYAMTSTAQYRPQDATEGESRKGMVITFCSE